MYNYINGLCTSHTGGESRVPIVNYMEISQMDFKGYFPTTILNIIIGSRIFNEHKKMFNYLRKRKTELGEPMSLMNLR